MSKQPEIDLNEKFYIFDNFITSTKHILERGDEEWNSSKIFFQLSIEHADNSPLTYGAEKYEGDGKVDFDYVRDVNRDEDIYISPLVTILEGHNGPVKNIEILDDKYILSYSRDETLRIWDINSYKCLINLEIYIYNLSNAKILENNNILLVSGSDIIILDENSYECIVVLEGHEDSINGIEILENKNIISYSDDGTLRVWDKDSFKLIAILKGHENRIENIKILENKNIISYSNETLQVWDKDSYESIVVLEGHKDSINGIEILENKNIISYSDDGTLRVWDKDSYKCIIVLTGHKNRINFINILPDGNVVSFSLRKSILWDIKTYKKIDMNLNDTSIYWEKGFGQLKNNNIVLNAGNNIKILDELTYKCKAVLQGHDGNIQDIKILPNQYIVSSSRDRTLRIWNTSNIKYSNKLIKNEEVIYSSLLEKKMFFILSNYKIEVYSENESDIIYTIEGHKDKVNGIKILRNKNIITYSNDTTLRIWDKNNYKCIAVLEGHESSVIGMEILQNNIFSYSEDGVIRIWDKNNYESIKVIKGHEKKINGINILENKNIASYSRDGTIKIWNKDSYECLSVLKGHSKSVNGMKILENKNFISYSDDGTLRIWDKNSYECINILKGHENPIIGIEILENKNFISYSNDIVNIFCKDSYKCIKSIQVDNDFEDLNIKILDNNNFILYWKETPYSRRMLSSRDFQIRVFDKDSYECLMIIGKNNIDEYYSSLAVIDSIIDCADYIFSNYFEETFLYIKDKKIESDLKWFSNYTPKINTILGDNVCVNDNQSMRFLKVINHEK